MLSLILREEALLPTDGDESPSSVFSLLLQHPFCKSVDRLLVGSLEDPVGLSNTGEYEVIDFWGVWPK